MAKKQTKTFYLLQCIEDANGLELMRPVLFTTLNAAKEEGFKHFARFAFDSRPTKDALDELRADLVWGRGDDVATWICNGVADWFMKISRVKLAG